MTKYRKKPVVIDALVFTDDSERLIEIQEFMEVEFVVDYKDPKAPVLKIGTLEGIMKANIGDYIIKGINGEFYPCKPEIFEKTYEKVV
ncbi:hypothetical protein [Oceanobacillus sojae]|uniref:hypothetical protein n=1 Tax=Oceanobacillus sojae TaxID=582851 RepID=UPI0021A5EA2F|nr:hypothetical protein [Oceanobacillus sojae]MCT1904109.1 hypothetical protein [Oceanobacillus sojae]